MHASSGIIWAALGEDSVGGCTGDRGDIGLHPFLQYSISSDLVQPYLHSFICVSAMLVENRGFVRKNVFDIFRPHPSARF